MKYNNAIFNYCLLLFIYVFIYFILFCYQTHLLRVTFKFTTTVCDSFVFFFFFKIKVPSDISRRQILTL